MNKIVTENSQVGAPASEWDIIGTDDGSIEGFATEMSVNLGETVHFKINSAATAYRLDIYRIGYYAGNGARKVTAIWPSVGLPQLQPPGLTNPTGIQDCGNWAVSASWAVPADTVSGIYFAKLVREDGNPASAHVLFVVRDDDSHSDLLFQTSDTTWQAYNTYGGASMYTGGPGPQGGAYKVSYNRPITTRQTEPQDWVFNAEYPMVRWLEANGYDVSYCSGIDTDRFSDKILRHKVFLSVGHDEYWSARQRANVEAAREAGVHLAFFSGNEVYWKTRWENSIDGTDTPYRTLVCYKDTHANAAIDPTGAWTGTWRDSRFSPPADGGRPENALTGTIFGVQGFTDNAISVPAEEGRLRFWRNTTMATLAAGTEDKTTTGTLGYEWDEDVDNGFRPAGLFRLSSTTINTNDYLLDNGSTTGPGTPTHHLTLYRHKSGALVFGAGSAQWSWGLDGHHDTHGNDPGTPDQCVQQAMVNLFADMGVQPASLQPDLVSASASTDTTAPTSTISFPSHGDVLQPGAPINILNSILGSATDADGKVAAVEVSVDGGLTWHPAVGRESWSYPWTPSGNGLVTILSRAVDDSGNLEVPSAGIDVIVGAADEEGPGGPILVIVNGSYSATNPFGNYLGEILRAEGLVTFKKIELTLLMRKADPLAFLNSFKLVLLAETRLLPAPQLLMRDYVSGGGNLIAMRPDPAMADVFGLSLVGHRPEQPGQPQFFAFETSFGPGVGIQSGPLQYHGDADKYSLAGATTLAHLWHSIGTPFTNPAVTVNQFGGGKASAFIFDLAKSIVLMRQGNPNWRDAEGDGFPSYRPMDMFAQLDGKMWFDPEHLLIPQADEQQRFLANLILTLVVQPLPRLWYLPAMQKVLVVNTGDGEKYDLVTLKKVINDITAHGGTFTTYLRRTQIADPPGTGVVDEDTEKKWRADGHGVGVHVFAGEPGDTDGPQTYENLREKFIAINGALKNAYGHEARTVRSHTIDWVGWVDMAKIEAEFGTRLDLNYYHYWRFDAVTTNPQLKLPTDKTKAHGYFTGSGLPQKFCDENGATLPIYQLLTEWSDEFFADNKYSAIEVSRIIESMIVAAQNGFYSAFVANIHHGRYAGDDSITGTWAHAMWDYAQTNGLPMWSAEKFLDFVEARTASTLDNITWDGTHLTFDFNTPTTDQEVTLMIPDQGLLSVTVDGVPVSFIRETIKGRSYVLFTTGSMSSHVVVSYEPA